MTSKYGSFFSQVALGSMYVACMARETISSKLALSLTYLQDAIVLVSCRRTGPFAMVSLRPGCGPQMRTGEL